MWVFLGLITMLAWAAYAFATRHGAGWKGQRAEFQGVAYDWAEARTKHALILRFGVRLPEDYEFVLREETGRDRWFKRAGISAEMSVGDAALDMRVYVESNDPVLRDLLRDDATLRTALLSLLRECRARRASAVSLHAAAGRLWVQIVAPLDVGRMRYVDRVVPVLDAFARALRARPLRGPLPQRDPFIGRAALLLALSSASVLLGFLGWYHWSFGRDPIIDAATVMQLSVPLGLLLQGGLVWIALRWLGRSARTHLVLLELLLMGGLGLQASSLWLTREANMSFDVGPARRVDYAEAHITTHRSRRSTTYRLHLAAPQPSDAAAGTVRIDRALAATLRQGQSAGWGLSGAAPARVSMREGAFGFPWIEHIEPLTTPSAAARP